MSNQSTSIYEGLQKITGLWKNSNESFSGKNIIICKGEIVNDKQRYDIFANSQLEDTNVRVGILWSGKTKGGKSYYFGFMFDARAIVLRNKKSKDNQPDFNLFITKKDYIKKDNS